MHADDRAAVGGAAGKPVEVDTAIDRADDARHGDRRDADIVLAEDPKTVGDLVKREQRLIRRHDPNLGATTNSWQPAAALKDSPRPPL